MWKQYCIHITKKRKNFFFFVQMCPLVLALNTKYISALKWLNICQSVLALSIILNNFNKCKYFIIHLSFREVFCIVSLGIHLGLTFPYYTLHIAFGLLWVFMVDFTLYECQDHILSFQFIISGLSMTSWFYFYCPFLNHQQYCFYWNSAVMLVTGKIR